MEPLPEFKYHPDPVKTGAIAKSDAGCECCGRVRGYVYTLTIYAEDEIEHICPWCIASGDASEKFNGDFVDAHPLAQAGLTEEITKEVSQRTPAYESWQQESWLACCDDACEFHGDATTNELLALNQDELASLAKEVGFSFEVLSDVITHYEPKGSPAFYKFVCRHCGKVKHHCDFH
jgi:uncharacterized protein